MSGQKHIGHQVIALMDRLGVSPLTRNYHLFYICIANSNPLVRRAVRNVGRYPSQQNLDQIIEEFCPEAVDSRMCRRHESVVTQAMSECASRLQSEQIEMASFQSAIQRVSAALARSSERERLTTDILLKVADAISEAGNRRVASSDRALRKMSRDRAEVDALRSELLKARRMADTDMLTGLSNRRAFDEKLAALFGRDTAFALMLIDVDHFKHVNDAYGHLFGDHVLKEVANEIQRSARKGTFVARTGGEEFAVIVPKATANKVMCGAEKIRIAVENAPFRNQDHEIRVTISIGAAMANQTKTPQNLYEAADIALYRSKNAGRNRITLYAINVDEESSSRYQMYTA